METIKIEVQNSGVLKNGTLLTTITTGLEEVLNKQRNSGEISDDEETDINEIMRTKELDDELSYILKLLSAAFYISKRNRDYSKLGYLDNYIKIIKSEIKARTPLKEEESPIVYATLDILGDVPNTASIVVLQNLLGRGKAFKPLIHGSIIKIATVGELIDSYDHHLLDNIDQIGPHRLKVIKDVVKAIKEARHKKEEERRLGQEINASTVPEEGSNTLAFEG